MADTPIEKEIKIEEPQKATAAAEAAPVAAPGAPAQDTRGRGRDRRGGKGGDRRRQQGGRDAVSARASLTKR
jgi:hypothetical protein